MATYEITCICGYREQKWVSITMEAVDIVEKCPKCGNKLKVKMIYYDSATSHSDD